MPDASLYGGDPVSQADFTFGGHPPSWEFSDAATRLFGRPVGSRGPAEVVLDAPGPRSYAEVLGQAVDGCLREGRAFVVVTPLRAARGRAHWVAWRGQRVHRAHVGPQVRGEVLDITSAFQQELNDQTSAHLHAALATRHTIDLAKGALMLAYGVDAVRAFDLLAWTSQRANVRVHDLAERLTTTIACGSALHHEERERVELALLRPVPGPGEQCSAPRMTVAHSSVGGAAVLAVEGSVDLALGRQFAAAVGERLDALSRGDVLLVDLSGVEFVGPAARAVLDSAARRARGEGVDLRVLATGDVGASFGDSEHVTVLTVDDDPLGYAES